MPREEYSSATLRWRLLTHPGTILAMAIITLWGLLGFLFAQWLSASMMWFWSVVVFLFASAAAKKVIPDVEEVSV